MIVGVNLSWFARRPARQQPVLAGLLPVSRWGEAARLPMHAIGLAAADIVTYRSAVASGHFEDWRWLRRQQGRFASSYADWVGTFQKWAGEGGGMAYQRALSANAFRLGVRARRATTTGARRNLGPFLDGLAPDDPDLRELAERQGAAFLDIHDLLPDRSFRDAMDHLAYADATQPAAAVAARLLPWALGHDDWAARAAGLPAVKVRGKRKEN